MSPRERRLVTIANIPCPEDKRGGHGYLDEKFQGDDASSVVGPQVVGLIHAILSGATVMSAGLPNLYMKRHSSGISPKCRPPGPPDANVLRWYIANWRNRKWTSRSDVKPNEAHSSRIALQTLRRKFISVSVPFFQSILSCRTVPSEISSVMYKQSTASSRCRISLLRSGINAELAAKVRNRLGEVIQKGLF